MRAMQTTHPRHFAIVPAAGSGSRMAATRPKQYLSLLGRPLIHHALSVLCAAPAVDAVFVVLSVDDTEWATHDWSALGPKLRPLFCGGATRADSVLGGLRAIAGDAAAGDWVLVHDAARPCLAPWHVDKLVRELAHDEVGGLLAVPVADTLKRADAQQHICATLDRRQLWQAQTPQLFAAGLLQRALAAADLDTVTDEASAIEALGLQPLLVLGDSRNLKMTLPQDEYLVRLLLGAVDTHSA